MTLIACRLIAIWLVPLGLATLLMASSLVGAERPPNLILIMADDMGRETLGCYGGSSYATPNIDRLAASGLRFEHAYATPLCTNTRIQLMTGKYNHRNWLGFGLLDPREKTFGHYLQAAGYRTCIAGKWQLTSYDPTGFPGSEKRRGKGMHPRDAGFDEYSLWHTGDTETKGSRYADPVIDSNGVMLDGDGKYGPDVWTDTIKDFITRHREQPFFVYYSMALPHWPFVPTPDSAEWQDPKARLKEDLKHAAEMIEYTDKAVGRIVDHVDQLGLGSKTVIMFYTDNGTDWRVTSRVGEQLVRGGKSFATDAGTRVPLVVRWPETVRAGSSTRALVDSTDFLPTLADLAGAPVPASKALDGRSFGPLLTGTGQHDRSWVYLHQDPRPGWDKDRFSLIRFARDQDFKLYEDGRLYAVNTDPQEDRPAFMGTDNEVSGKVRRRLQDVLDSMLPYPRFDPRDMWRPGNHKDPFSGYRFQQRHAEVIAEVESVTLPGDESWQKENAIPGYLGKGYLRALRNQEEGVGKGVLEFRTKLGSSGTWFLGIRHRSDHYREEKERAFWLRVEEGPWMSCRSHPDLKPGRWGWPILVAHPERGEVPLESLEFEFRLRSNVSTYGKNNPVIAIAPQSQNLKIDRLILYQADRKDIARFPGTPATEYHPW